MASPATIVTSAYHPEYHTHLIGWAYAVHELVTPPEHIIIAHHDIDPDIRAHVDTLIRPQWVPIPHKPRVLASTINHAIAHVETPWVVKIDADDRILPHALGALHRTPEDIYGYGIRIYPSGVEIRSRKTTADEILTNQDNLLFSCSPFRKTVWDLSPYQDIDMEDWWFWITAAHNGFTFTASEGVDYQYTQHPQQRTNEYDADKQREWVRQQRSALINAGSAPPTEHGVGHRGEHRQMGDHSETARA